MVNNITDDEMWDLIGFLKVSKTRLRTLEVLKNNFLMPSEISEKTGIQTTQVSNALQDLKNKDLVKCMNDHAHKGRIYQSTDLGLAILKIIEDN